MDECTLWIRRGSHRLAATLTPAPGPRARLAVLSHGFMGARDEEGRLFVHTARALARGGISALRFDFMGSGSSSGEFWQMSPQTEIADLLAVVGWARRRYRSIGLLGLSFGGAVSICAAASLPPGRVAALCTWSTVPSFLSWRSRPEAWEMNRENSQRVGRCFFRDRPRVDVPQAYRSIAAPKLQIQGDQDLPGFREEFASYFPAASEPKRHLVLPGADHVFTHSSHRRLAIRETVRFFRKHL